MNSPSGWKMRRTSRLADTSHFLSIVLKLLGIVALIAVGVIIYSTCSGSPLIQKIDKTLPGPEIIYEVPTVTRTYLAEKAVQNDDGSVTMTHWYQREKNRWAEYPGTITLPAVVKPRVQRRVLTSS